MRERELEDIILRAMAEYFADLLLRRAAGDSLPRRAVAVTADGRGVYGAEEARSCPPGSELRLRSQIVITPLASDELVRRGVRIVRIAGHTRK